MNLPANVVLPLLTSLLFSGSYIAGKYTTADLGPLTTSLLRYAVALGFLSLMALLAPLASRLVPWFGNNGLRVQARDLPWLVGLGLSGIVGYHYFFFMSLRFTEVANTAIINAMSPVVTGLMASVFIGERLSRRNYLGIGIAFVGVMVLVTRADWRTILSLDFNRGDVLMLLSVLCWVGYALIIKHLSARINGFALTFYATAFGVLLLCPLAWGEGASEQFRNISPASTTAVLYMGVFASGLGYLTYNLSIQRLGPTCTSSFVYSTVPVFVVILALIFFAEAVTDVMAASMALILIGLRFALSVSEPP